VEYNNIVGTYQYNIIQTTVRAPVQITHILPHQIGTPNYTFIFLLVCREFIVYISSDRKFSIGLPARKIWKETVHDSRQRTQYFRMDIVVPTTHTPQFHFTRHRADGLGHRIHRSPNIVGTLAK